MSVTARGSDDRPPSPDERSVRGVVPPANAEWMSTFRCNLHCPHCCAEAGPKADGELDTREGLALLEELAALGVQQMCISGGELTLRPDWEELLAFALGRFPRAAIITNGRLGRRLAETVDAMTGRAELALMVSLDGARETHDARRGPGAFDKVVELLAAPTRRRKILLTAVDGSNLADLARIERIGLDLGAEEWSIQPCIPFGRMAREGFVGEAGLRAIADFIAGAQQRLGSKMMVGASCWFGYFHPMRDARPWRGCPAGFEQIVVMPRGEVLTCGLVPAWTFGSVRERRLRDVWYGEEMDAVRRARPAGCGSCSDCARGCEGMQRMLDAQFCKLG